ncbi:MAG: hypothetical protein ACYTF6_06170 [Planctomycetota bacterium]|jgi:tetratricopeptide (TPR) repeat protein
MRTVRLLAFVVLPAAVLLLTKAAPAQPPARPAKDVLEAKRQRVVAELIESIAEAKDPPSAAETYARGKVIDPANVELHETYMERMLKFGLPKIAVYPARDLLNLDPHHGTAWRVIGYLHAQKGEMAKAFDAIITAVRHIQDNPSLSSNAGQLAAWCEYEPDLPKLSPAARHWLKETREELAGNEDFAASYDKIAEAYEQRSKALADYDEKISAGQVALAAQRSQLRSAETIYNSITFEANSHSARISELDRELQLCQVKHHPDASHTEAECMAHTEQLRKRIWEEETALEDALERAADSARDVAPIRSQVNQQEANLAGLNAGRDRADKRVYKLLAWEPPAVDGVVTAEVERFDYSKLRRGRAPDDPEALAAQRLRVAQLYMRHNLTEKAVEILTQICKLYASTEAGAEARPLLETMKQQAGD